MQANYQVFIDRVIHKYEGGYGWSKADPGGPTKYGITCYDLAEFNHVKMSSMSAWASKVQAMPLSTAETIYASKYAGAVRFNDLPSGSDCAMLDYQINSGSRAILAARAVLNVKGGSLMDQALLDAIKKADPATFVTALCAERMHFLRGLRTWGTFGGGWTSRVNDLKAYCLHLAKGGVAATAPVAPDLTHTVTPKGVHVAQTATASTTTGAVASAGGVVAVGYPWYWAVGAFLVIVVGGVIYEAIEASKASTANTTVVIPPGTVLPVVPAIPAHAAV
jgi:lysozyme family protein